MQPYPTPSAVCTMGGGRIEGREVRLGLAQPTLEGVWVDWSSPPHPPCLRKEVPQLDQLLMELDPSPS